MEVKVGNIEIEKDGVKITLTIEEAKELSKKLTDIFWPTLPAAPFGSTVKFNVENL